VYTISASELVLLPKLVHGRELDRPASLGPEEGVIEELAEPLAVMLDRVAESVCLCDEQPSKRR